MPEEVTQVMSAVGEEENRLWVYASKQGGHRTLSFTKSIYSY